MNRVKRILWEKRQQQRNAQPQPAATLKNHSRRHKTQPHQGGHDKNIQETNPVKQVDTFETKRATQQEPARRNQVIERGAGCLMVDLLLPEGHLVFVPLLNLIGRQIIKRRWNFPVGKLFWIKEVFRRTKKHHVTRRFGRDEVQPGRNLAK